MSKPSALIEERVDAVFHDLVTTALERHAVATSPTTEFYLVRLLVGFARAAPHSLAQALGVELASSMELLPGERYLRIKELADTTLFLTGVFLDHMEARAAATDYYFELGKRAYLDLHALEGSYAEPPGEFADTYHDLSHRFEAFAGVLTSIADRSLFPIRSRLERLYHRWLDSGDERYRRPLCNAGLAVCAQAEGGKH